MKYISKKRILVGVLFCGALTLNVSSEIVSDSKDRIKESFSKLQEFTGDLKSQVAGLSGRRKIIKGELSATIKAYRQDSESYRLTPDDRIKLTESKKIKEQIAFLSDQIRNNNLVIELLKKDLFEKLPLKQKIVVKLKKFKVIDDKGKEIVLDKIISSLREERVLLNDIQIGYINSIVDIALKSDVESIRKKAFILRGELERFGDNEQFYSIEDVINQRLEMFSKISDEGKIIVLETMLLSLDKYENQLDESQLYYINEIIKIISNLDDAIFKDYIDAFNIKLNPPEELVWDYDIKIRVFTQISDDGKFNILEKIILFLEQNDEMLDQQQLKYINNLVTLSEKSENTDLKNKAQLLRNKLQINQTIAEIKFFLSQKEELFEDRKRIDLNLFAAKLDAFKVIPNEGKIVVLGSVIDFLRGNILPLNIIQIEYVKSLINIANLSTDSFLRTKATVLRELFHDYLLKIEEFGLQADKEKLNKLNIKNYREPIQFFNFDKAKIKEYFDLYARLRKSNNANIVLNIGKKIEINNFSSTHRAFDLSNTTINDQILFKAKRRADFINIEREAFFKNLITTNNFIFQNVIFSRDVSFVNARFTNAGGFNKTVAFKNVTFKEDLDLSGVTVAKGVTLEFRKVIINGKLKVDNLVFEKGSTLRINSRIIKHDFKNKLLSAF